MSKLATTTTTTGNRQQKLRGVHVLNQRLNKVLQHCGGPLSAAMFSNSFQPPKTDSSFGWLLHPLSGEGVVSSYSVLATGLVSRHRAEFGMSQACRFWCLEAPRHTILGAPKCLQTGRALAPELVWNPARGWELPGSADEST